MTQRGRGPWPPQNAYELTARGSKCQHSAGACDEEEDPQPHSSLLRKNSYDECSDFEDTDQTAAPDHIQQSSTSMSKSPLLRRSPSERGSDFYGALRDEEPSSSDHTSDDEADDVRKRDIRKGKNLALFPSASTESSGSRQPEYQDTSSSQSRKRRKRHEPGFAVTFTEHGDTTGAHSGFPSGLPTLSDSDSDSEESGFGEEAVDIDAAGDKAIIEDPLDNSPSVYDAECLPFDHHFHLDFSIVLLFSHR